MKTKDLVDLVKSATIADSQTKGYKFSCSQLPRGCCECDEKIVTFITQDLEEAYQHSKINNVAIWISKD